MRKLWLICACCAVALMLSYSPPPARSWLPSLGISHAAAQVFPGHYRRVARRGYRRAARYAAYTAGAAAGAYYGSGSYYGGHYGAYSSPYGGYYGGYGWGGLGG